MKSTRWEDFRGDPASAMLEVLDLEQNSTFVDYLEVEYDLSNVMFITTTANSYNMPEPAAGPMEIISSPAIPRTKARSRVSTWIPKQLKNHGLRKGELDHLRCRADLK
ncbi:MAG: hypothetical protein R3D84_08315 [Paracoccaceae bacterium]